MLNKNSNSKEIQAIKMCVFWEADIGYAKCVLRRKKPHILKNGNSDTDDFFLSIFIYFYYINIFVKFGGWEALL